MSNLNSWKGIGSLTRDPELRSTTKGNAVMDMRVAVNYQYLNDKKEVMTESCFVDIEIFGNKAKECAKVLKHGSSVYINGRIRLDKWHDSKTKEPRTKLMIRASEVSFLDPSDKSKWPVEAIEALDENDVYETSIVMPTDSTVVPETLQ